MQVHQILKSKADDSVVTVSPGITLSEATELLSAKRIGAVIVSEDGKTAAGILSERDIVRELGRRGTDCMTDVVEKVMTPDPVSCARDDSSDDVFAKMTEGRFRHIPVLDNGQMIGLISIGDIVKARLSELAMENDALQHMIMGN